MNRTYAAKRSGKLAEFSFNSMNYTLAVFGAGVAVGKFVEKNERLDRKTEDKDKHIRKNDRQ